MIDERWLIDEQNNPIHRRKMIFLSSKKEKLQVPSAYWRQQGLLGLPIFQPGFSGLLFPEGLPWCPLLLGWVWSATARSVRRPTEAKGRNPSGKGYLSGSLWGLFGVSIDIVGAIIRWYRSVWQFSYLLFASLIHLLTTKYHLARLVLVQRFQFILVLV